MTEKRRYQATSLLEQFKNGIVKQQGEAVTNHDKEEYNRLYEAWALLDDIEGALIYELD